MTGPYWQRPPASVHAQQPKQVTQAVPGTPLWLAGIPPVTWLADSLCLERHACSRSLAGLPRPCSARVHSSSRAAVWARASGSGATRRLLTPAPCLTPAAKHRPGTLPDGLLHLKARPPPVRWPGEDLWVVCRELSGLIYATTAHALLPPAAATNSRRLDCRVHLRSCVCVLQNSAQPPHRRGQAAAVEHAA